MKKKSKLLAFALGVVLLVGPLPCVGVSAAVAPSFTSDTKTNITLLSPRCSDNQDDSAYYHTDYGLLLTVSNSNKAPVVISGNSKLVTVKLSKKTGNKYYYDIHALYTAKNATNDPHRLYQKAVTGTEKTGTVGIYAAMPGQQYKRLFIVDVKRFDQLYPQPVFGTVLNGKWEVVFYYGYQMDANKNYLDKYMQMLEDKFPDYNKNLPTDVAPEGTIRQVHVLWVYLNGPAGDFS